MIEQSYATLCEIAMQRMQCERESHTLQATALANETYLVLRRQENIDWSDPLQIRAAAATTMRRLLVDHARSRLRDKRGRGFERLNVDLADYAAPLPDPRLLALNSALEELAQASPRQSQVVELRYFGAASIGETAKVLAVSESTVKNDWRFARAWLEHRMGECGS